MVFKTLYQSKGSQRKKKPVSSALGAVDQYQQFELRLEETESLSSHLFSSQKYMWTFTNTPQKIRRDQALAGKY